MEIENLTVKEFSMELAQLTSRPDLYEPTPPVSYETREYDVPKPPNKRNKKRTNKNVI
jgi:hypothetical protein